MLSQTTENRDRNIELYSPSRMTVERIFKAQQSLAEAHQGPIKRLNYRIAGRIYNDESGLDKSEKNLDKLQIS